MYLGGERLKKQQTKEKRKKSITWAFHGSVFFALLGILILGGFASHKVYNKEKVSNARFENVTEISKVTPIKAYFKSRMLRKSVEEGIQIDPKLKFKTNWINDKELEIIPTEYPHPNSEYTLRIIGSKTAWFIPQKNFVTTFKTITFPHVTSFYPANEQQEVSIGEKITIDLDRPLAREFNLQIKISPLTGFEHSFNEQRNQIIISPSAEMEKGQEYRIKVTLQHDKFSEVKKDLYQSKFFTKPPPLVVYSFDKDGNPAHTEERIEEVLPQITEGRYVDVDISSQTLFIFEDGVEKGAFKVSTGLRGMDTPTGEFKVMSKKTRPWSAKYKLYMPWFIQFTGQGHGIHELPEWPGGYKEGANHLGIPVSHGCIRLGVGPAKMVYDFVESGTPMVIHK